MKKSEIDVLQECLEWLEAGMPLEECLQKVPVMTTEMRGILETASEMIELGENQVDLERIVQGRTRLLQQASLYRDQDERTPRSALQLLTLRIRRATASLAALRPVVSRLALILGITVLLIAGSGGLVMASAESIPGDSLYAVKRAVEDIRVYLEPNEVVRQEFEENFSKQRVDEVMRLVAIKRVQHISFDGILEQIDGMRWTVSGIPVGIQASTIFVGGDGSYGAFVPGVIVEVEGETGTQGVVNGNEVHLLRYQFQGTVEAIDQDTWLVSGITLNITPQTHIEQGIRVGDQVTVVVRSEDKGISAISIEPGEQPTAIPELMETEEHTNDSESEPHEAISTEMPESTDEEHEGEAHPVETGEVTQEHEGQITSEPDEYPEYNATPSQELHETPEPPEAHEANP